MAIQGEIVNLLFGLFQCLRVENVGKCLLRGVERLSVLQPASQPASQPAAAAEDTCVYIVTWLDKTRKREHAYLFKRRLHFYGG